MAFIPTTTFLRPFSHSLQTCATTTTTPRIQSQPQRTTPFNSNSNSNSSKSSKPRRYRPGSAPTQKKKKLEPETVFIETSPSRYELIVPTLSILTVIGIIPFVAAVARAAWVKYKITSRRISISSGFQGREQTEIVYRDIEQIKYVKRLGGAADCVISLKDGAKLEIRAVPDFEKVFEYVMEKVDESVRENSGAA